MLRSREISLPDTKRKRPENKKKEEKGGTVLKMDRLTSAKRRRPGEGEKKREGKAPIDPPSGKKERTGPGYYHKNIRRSRREPVLKGT